MFSNAPVALRCTRMSLDLARRVRGTSAPDLAICVLFSSGVSGASNKGVLYRLTVRGEIGDAADGIALDLDVWTEHLADKRLEAAKRDDEEFVLG